MRRGMKIKRILPWMVIKPRMVIIEFLSSEGMLMRVLWSWNKGNARDSVYPGAVVGIYVSNVRFECDSMMPAYMGRSQ